MIKKLAIYLCLLITFTTASWAEDNSKTSVAFPLLGLWEATSVGLDAANSVTVPRTELNFSENNVLTFVIVDPSGKTQTPMRLRFEYAYVSPDIVTFQHDKQDKFIERYQFKIDGNTFSWRQLDFGTVGTFRRIETTGFSEQPTDLKEIPKPQ